MKVYTKFALMMVMAGAFLYTLAICYTELFGSQQPLNISSRVFEILKNTDEIVATTGKKTDRQTYRGQTDRQIDRHTHTHTHR